jgi:hypothetical protein
MKRIINIAALAVIMLAASAVSATAQNQTDKFLLVTDASSLAAGDTIIVVAYRSDVGLRTISTTQAENNRPATVCQYNDDRTITPPNDAAIIVLGGESGKWTLRVTNGDAQGYLYAGSSSGNIMKTSTDVNSYSQATISINSESIATIKFLGNHSRNIIMFTTNGGLFSCYEASSSTVFKPQIYRKRHETHTKGDINDDGRVTIADVTSLVNIILGNATGHENTADLNGDESITIADVTTLVNIILGKQ